MLGERTPKSLPTVAAKFDIMSQRGVRAFQLGDCGDATAGGASLTFSRSSSRTRPGNRPQSADVKPAGLPAFVFGVTVTDKINKGLDAAENEPSEVFKIGGPK